MSQKSRTISEYKKLKERYLQKVNTGIVNLDAHIETHVKELDIKIKNKHCGIELCCRN